MSRLDGRIAIIFAGAGLALFVAALILTTMVATMSIRATAPEDKPPAETKCVAPPETTMALAEIKTLVAANSEELRQLQKDLRELAEAEAEPEDNDMAEVLSGRARDLLPPGYVDKVDRFFESDAPKALLKPAAKNDPSLAFGRPRFVTHDILAVPYEFSDNQHYIIVGIGVLDYYDLEFGLIWDSLEGQ